MKKRSELKISFKNKQGILVHDKSLFDAYLTEIETCKSIKNYIEELDKKTKDIKHKLKSFKLSSKEHINVILESLPLKEKRAELLSRVQSLKSELFR